MTSRILSSTAWKMPLGRLDARAGRRADMELDLAAVDQREEVAADEDEHVAAERQDQDGDDRHEEARCEKRREQTDIAGAHPLEAAVEAMCRPRTSRAGRPRRRRRDARPWAEGR